MENVKTEVISVIRRATGFISKSFRTCLNNRPAKHDIKELQKTVTLDNAYILLKALT
jgi:hypothetical protein